MKRAFGTYLRIALSIVIPLASLGAVALVAAFVPEKVQEKQPPPEKPVPVVVRPVERSTVRDTLYLPAVVEPERVVKVAAEVAGRVASYAGRGDRVGDDGAIVPGPRSAGTIDEGIRIRAGSPLLYLNTDILRPEYRRADAAYRLALRELERVQSLQKSGAATATELDRAQTEMETAKAAMELARQRLRRAVIRAPIAGIVDRMHVEEGDYVSPGTPVADIVDLSIAKIVFDVPEKDIAYFRAEAGKQVTIRLRDSGAAFDGTVTYIGARADRESLTTPMKVSVDNSAGRLHSGQILKADILRRTVAGAIMVPLKSVIAYDEKGRVRHAVYVVDNKKAVRRYVEIDLNLLRGEDVLVRDGLAEGELLIVDGQRQVGPGQAVEIVERAAPAASGGE